MQKAWVKDSQILSVLSPGLKTHFIPYLTKYGQNSLILTSFMIVIAKVRIIFMSMQLHD
jgi:hypothetical protein